MRRYEFRMEPVLRVRRIEQDSAQAHLAAARRDLGAAEEALHDAIERYRSIPQTDGPRPATAWLAHRSGIERTAATVVAVGAQRAHAASQEAERLAALHDARRRVVALERLDERRRAEHVLELRRAEDSEIDELVTSRWGRTS